MFVLITNLAAVGHRDHQKSTPIFRLSVLVSFPVHIGRSNLRGKRLILSQGRRYSTHGGEIKTAAAQPTPHITDTARGAVNGDTLLSSFSPSGIRVREWSGLQWASSSTSINVTIITPHTHAQMRLSLVILDPVKLTSLTTTPTLVKTKEQEGQGETRESPWLDKFRPVALLQDFLASQMCGL